MPQQYGGGTTTLLRLIKGEYSLTVARQRHYKNYGLGAETAFVTTTCLDFAQVFADPVCADMMAATLAEACHRSDARLHAFVVMPHHIHFLVTPHKGYSIKNLVRNIKANSARRIGPVLDDLTRKAFEQQMGLNRHKFWQRSFRSFVVSDQSVFDQKVHYIHDNPVRAGLVTCEGMYRWSSFVLFEEGFGIEDFSLDLSLIQLRYSPDGLPSVTGTS